MGSRELNGQKNTDRILITVALVILLLASGLFYFDGWMWGGRKSRGESIGVITSRSGDVRMKFEDDLKWQKAANGSDLEYNDAVYVGGGSQAELALGESKMTVTENTLIVLRRDQNVNFMNLSYGTLFGKIAANEKIVIDTGSGKPIEFKTNNKAQIVLHRRNGKTQLDVTSGEAEVTIDGKMTKVNKSSRLVIGDKTPAEMAPNHLKILHPLKDQVITSEQASKIDFAWAWDNGRKAQPSERFTLEFSAEKEFTHVHIVKQVQGQLTTSMTVAQSISLFYRVKAANNEVSPVEKVNFVRLEKPLIVQPQAAAHIEAADGKVANVQFEFRRPKAASVSYQVSREADFQKVLVDQSTTELTQVKALPTGPYFVRARSDFGNGRVTGWTEPQAFSVDPRAQVFPLAQAHLPTRIVIPNSAYPRTLYWAPSEMVQSFLATRGFMHDFFPFKADEIDELKVQMENGNKELYSQKDPAWPQQKLRPGRYAYRYQASKAGFLPSAWSKSKGLEIVMEPPKPMGEASYGEVDPGTGNRQASWNFTPLLFAKSYDIEVAQNPGFADALEFKTEKTTAESELPPGEYFWRARARDSQGRIISDFSKPYKMKSMPQAAPPMLARNIEKTRRPAQAERTSTRIERVREQAWQRSGWWGWVGSGENYVDYRQSLPGVGTVTSHGLKGGSQYFEGGYLGGSGIGGVFSYKNTPGEIHIDDVPILPTAAYRWTTVSLEGMAKRTSPFTLFDSPITWGLRAGVQQHQMPFLSLNDTATAVYLKNNQMTAGSVGLMAEWARSRWTYYWTMRYQVPLSTKADGAASFSNTPVFAFDGSLGTSYNFTQRMKAGLFWYGQWHQMNFDYNDGTVTNAGFQSLFYSSVDARLGFDF